MATVPLGIRHVTALVCPDDAAQKVVLSTDASRWSFIKPGGHGEGHITSSV
ncbi:Hypothetical protein DHA2_151238 [Giardia duodenalis]|uniref:Uncharacterized protein n=1 Tax=Giardia intestinalis TaxID=5741 RepID=V6TEK3_GIAIN|nr:Hypothetical protein DHA2_151238 [Giardia intestinalis]